MNRTRVLALWEPGRRGGAAVAYAVELAKAENLAVTVVSVVVQASGPRCGTSIRDYNLAVKDVVATELGRLRSRLGQIGATTAYKLLVEDRDLSLPDFTNAGGFDLVLLPSRRRRLGGALRHPTADLLRMATRAELRIIDREAAVNPGDEQNALLAGCATTGSPDVRTGSAADTTRCVAVVWPAVAGPKMHKSRRTRSSLLRRARRLH
jgi:hypothetical protein